jgi:nitroimidazol reductase NimA-like FMN-containing flavoprotein (pyridoxamine 5'-phosphate oxidase superfamily)
MRRHEREIVDPSIIQEIFKKSIICRVAFQGQEY